MSAELLLQTTDVSQGVGSSAFKRQLQLPMSYQVSHYHGNTSESSAVSAPKVPANMCAETVVLIIVSDQCVFKCLHVQYV